MGGLVGKVGIWVAAAALIWVWVRMLEWKTTFYPSRQLWCTPAEQALEYEEVHFVAEDACRLHGWWITGPPQGPRGGYRVPRQRGQHRRSGLDGPGVHFLGLERVPL